MVRTKRWLYHFEAARSTPHRAPPPTTTLHHPPPTPPPATSNAFAATPLHFPPSFPTRRMHCLPLVRVRLLTVSTNRSFPSGYPALLVRSRLCCLTWCPYTPHGPTLPSCRPSPCVCARPVCPSYPCASAALPCHYPKLAPLAPASRRVCPLPYGRRAPNKTQTCVHEHVGSLVAVAVRVKERR